MSSPLRRLQIRAFQKGNQRKIPVLHPTTGNILTTLWPRRPRQVAYVATPTGTRDVFADTKDTVLQPLIDILADMARKNRT